MTLEAQKMAQERDRQMSIISFQPNMTLERGMMMQSIQEAKQQYEKQTPKIS